MTPRTQKVTFVFGAAVAGFRRVRTAAGRARDRDGMADGDFVLGDQNLLHEEPDDTLPLGDVQGLGGRAQPRQKAGQGLGEPQIGLPILGAIDGGFQLAVQRLFLTAELGRSVAQLVDGDQLFLIGRDQAVDTLADPDQAMPKVGLALLVGIGDAGRLQSPVDLCFHQRRIFEQADQLGPHNVVEQVLAHRTAAAQRAVEIAPGVGTQTAVVGDFAGTGLGRRAIQPVAALAARHQPLRDAGRLGPAPGEDLVLLQALFGEGEGLFADDGRHRDLDPVFSRPLVTDTVASGEPVAAAQRPHALARRRPGLAEARSSLVRRIAQHRPHHGAFPARTPGGRGNLAFVELAGDRTHAHVIFGVIAVDVANHGRLRFDDFIEGAGVLGFLVVAVAIGRTAEDSHVAASSPMALAATGTLQNLRTLVFRDHPLELDEEMVFGSFHRRRLQEHGLDALAGQLLDDQNLIGIAAAQTVRSMDQDGFDASLRGEVPDPLQPRAFENGAGKTVILDDHVGRHAVAVALGIGEQGLGLAGDGIAISLLLARDPRVQGCNLHDRLLRRAFAAGSCVPGRAPGSRRRSGAWRRAGGRRRNRVERRAESVSGVQP